MTEGDALWEFEQLFADVSSEMLSEMEPNEKEEGEEGEVDGEEEDTIMDNGHRNRQFIFQCRHHNLLRSPSR